MKTDIEFSTQDFEVFAKFKSQDIIAHKKFINKIEWNFLGNHLISSSQITLRLWAYDDIGGLTKSIDFRGGHETTADSLRWKDNNTLLTVSKESFKIWDIRDNKPIRSERNEKKLNVQGQWMPEGDTFAISSKDNIIYFYDRRASGLVESIKYQSEIGRFGWDNSSSVLLVATWENSTGNIEMRQSKVGYPLHQTFACHPAKITTFEIDHSNNYLATGSEDATINLYNLQQMLCIRSYYKTDGAINSLSFSPNNKYILVSSQEPQIDVYNIESGKHSYRKQNESGLGYSQVRWHPKKDIFAAIEQEDKTKKNEEGKIRIFNRRFQKSVS